MRSFPTSIVNEGFHVSAAVWLAEASRDAYEATTPDWAKEEGNWRSAYFDRGNIQGYWVASDGIALLAFRGTDNLGQWIRDARILPDVHPWGRVHRGFARGLAEVEVDLEAFDAVAAKARTVWLTGHSLGGALAVLAAVRMMLRGIETSVMTFGQPRVGLGDFQGRFDTHLPGRLIRVINQSDIVARLPPGLIYRHCGQVKRIVRPGVLEARGRRTLSPPVLDQVEPLPASEAEEDSLLAELDAHPDLFDETALRAEGRLMPAFAKDHSILEYIRLLSEIRDATLDAK